jgi:hypothetical protein
MKVGSYDQGPDNELMLRCDCGDDHFLVFGHYKWQEDEEAEVYLTVSDEWRSPRGLWGRIRAAFTLFHRGEYCRGDILVSKGKLLAIHSWCEMYLGENGRKEKD